MVSVLKRELGVREKTECQSDSVCPPTETLEEWLSNQSVIEVAPGVIQIEGDGYVVPLWDDGKEWPEHGE